MGLKLENKISNLTGCLAALFGVRQIPLFTITIYTNANPCTNYNSLVY